MTDKPDETPKMSSDTGLEYRPSEAAQSAMDNWATQCPVPVHPATVPTPTEGSTNDR